jgi:hypothetical protein
MNANEEGEICVYSCASVVRKSALGRPETKWGLARMERAKPVVHTFDVLVASRRAFATAAVSPFLHLIPRRRQHLPQSGWSKAAVHPVRRRC